jgi:putative transposase
MALVKRKPGWVDRRKAPPQPDDAALLADIKLVVADLPTYGYRRVWGVLRHQIASRAGSPVNHKRVFRVMKLHDLLLYEHGQKPVSNRKHTGKVAVDESDLRWCSDGFELPCDNGEKVRVAFSLDCCDREAMSWVATTKGIDANLVGDLMMQAVEYRFGAGKTAPREVEWLTDNGSCYIAHQTRSFAKQLGLKPLTTPVESPESNGMAESFVKTFKRDYASLAEKPDSETVMKMLPIWFEHYNTKHPHSALKYLSPRAFREKQALDK